MPTTRSSVAPTGNSTSAAGTSGSAGGPATSWRSALYPEGWDPSFTDENGLFLHDFSYAGYHLGENWHNVEKYAGILQKVFIVAVVLAVAGFIYYKKRGSKPVAG